MENSERRLIDRLETTDDISKSKTILNEILEDPFRNISVKQVDTIIDKKDSSYIIGGLRYLVFILYIRSCKDKLTNDEKEEATEILKKSEVISFIHEYYNIDEKQLSTEQQYYLHEVGTTSFIIRVDRGLKKDLALKLVKPRYINNPTIRRRTKNYFIKYRNLREFVPHVISSSEKYIFMEYIEGKTLREYIDNTLSDLSQQERLKSASPVLKKITEAIEYYVERDTYHHDISPDNIIIKENSDYEGDNRSDKEVVLIDFGHNYLILDRIGSIHQFGHIRTYIAQELQENPNIDSVLPDVYGLGTVAVELLGADKVGSSNLASLMDTCWDHYPEIAQAIEPLLSNNSDDRLSHIDSITSSSPETAILGSIRRSIDDSCLLAEERYDAEEWASRIPKLLSLFLLVGIDRLTVATRQALTLVSQEDASLGDRSYRLLCWAFTAEILYALIFFLTGLLILRDTGYVNNLLSVPILVPLAEALPGPIGDEYILPRLVGLSLGMAATRYYLHIFMTIDAYNVSSIMEYSIRANAFIWSIPLAWGVLLGPSDWGFFAGAGIILVSINNFICYNRISNIRDMLGFDTVKRSSEISHFLKVFWWWGPSMAIYGIVVGLVGLLLDLNCLQDNLFYLSIVLIINTVYLYYQMLSDYGPSIRSGLNRITSVYQT